MNIVERCFKTCEKILEYCPTFNVYDCTNCGASYREDELTDDCKVVRP